MVNYPTVYNPQAPLYAPNPAPFVEFADRCANILSRLRANSEQIPFSVGNPTSDPTLLNWIAYANSLVGSIFCGHMPEVLKNFCIDANGQACPFVEGHTSGPIVVCILIDSEVTQPLCCFVQRPDQGLFSSLFLRVPRNGGSNSRNMYPEYNEPPIGNWV